MKCSECPKTVSIARILANPRSITCSPKCGKDRRNRLNNERKKELYTPANSLVHGKAKNTRHLNYFLKWRQG